MRRLFVAIALIFAASGARAAECGLALAMAMDISSSVNVREYQIQKGGLADALRDPEVMDVILSPPGSVALAVYEWSGWQQQDVIAGWELMESVDDIVIFANRLDRHQRHYAEFSTALGRALDFGARLFNTLPFRCARHVIDVSGDGVNNQSVDPLTLRRAGRFHGLTINGLVIYGATPDPVPYYRDNVITGPGAFMMVARDGFRDYPELIKGKLLKELRPVLFIGAAPSGSETR